VPTDAAVGPHAVELPSLLVAGKRVVYRQVVVDRLRIDREDDGAVPWTQLVDDQQDEVAERDGQDDKWPLTCMGCHIVDNVVLLLVQRVKFALHVARLEPCAVECQVAQPVVVVLLPVPIAVAAMVLRMRLRRRRLGVVGVAVHVRIMAGHSGRPLQQLHNIPQRRMQQPFAHSQQMNQGLKNGVVLVPIRVKQPNLYNSLNFEN